MTADDPEPEFRLVHMDGWKSERAWWVFVMFMDRGAGRPQGRIITGADDRPLVLCCN